MIGEPIKVKDGTPYRSYLYAADLAIWLWTVLFKGETCHPYNVGSDQEITIAELAQAVATGFNGSIAVNALLQSPVTLPTRYVPDVTNGKRLFSLFTEKSLGGSILQTRDWIERNLKNHE
jgi:dTDP-glucose 4,6-dehydratase